MSLDRGDLSSIAARHYQTWNEASGKLKQAQAIVKDDPLLQKEKVLAKRLEDLGATVTSPETEARRKVKEKIYHQWALLYLQNHKQVQALDKDINDFIEKKTKSLQILHNKIQKVASKEDSPFVKREKVNAWLLDKPALEGQTTDAKKQAEELEAKLTLLRNNMKNLDAAFKLQSQMLDTIPALLGKINKLEKQIKFLIQNYDKGQSYGSKVTMKNKLNLLKQQQNELKKLEKELMHPTKIKEFDGASQEKQMAIKADFERVQSIKKDIDGLNDEIESIKDKVWINLQKAFSEAFQNVPLRTPKNLKAIRNYLEELQNLDPANKEIYKKLDEHTLTQFSFWEGVTKDLQGCYKLKKDGEIDLNSPMQSPKKIKSVMDIIGEDFSSVSNSLQELKDIIDKRKLSGNNADAYASALKRQLTDGFGRIL